MIDTNDRTKRHFIRGIIVKKDNNFYAPLLQVVKFCHRFPDASAKTIGDMIYDAISELKGNEELLKKVPEVRDVIESDGGINGKVSEKEA